MTAVPPLPQRSPLEEAVEQAVAKRHVFAQWPPVLRRAYFDQTNDTARSELRHLQMVGLGIAIVSVLLDAIAIPGELLRGLGLRAALVVLPAALLLAFSMRIRLQYLKLGTAYTLIAFAAIIMHMASFAEPATATRYTMAVTMLLGVGILQLPFLREELVGFATGFTAATIIVSIWPHPLPPLAMLEHMTITLLVFVAALTIAVRHGAEKDRNFLYDLRDNFVQAELEQSVRVLRELSESDALTGLANRRSFRSSFDSRFGGKHRIRGRSVTVMMIDLDHFKRFNDEFGHQAGDRALRHVGRCLEAGFNGVDGIVARFGGEEFIAAFHSASVAEAERIAEDVRQAICALEIPVRDSECQRITTSIGLASAGPAAKVDLGELTARADRALYRAKSDGRDRVVVSERIELRVDRLAG
jgi:diguanylate cyclase (GGDEF)-like protein